MNHASEMAFYQSLLNNLFDGVYFVDVDRNILYWNKGAEEISGFKSEEVVGRGCYDNILNHVDDTGKVLCTTTCPLAAVIADGQERGAEVYMLHKDGHRIPVSIRARPIYDDEGRIVGAVEVFRDISALRDADDRIKTLESQALLCALTQLGNRRYLDRVLQAHFEEFRRYGNRFGVLFADIDRFKKFNDTYGHETGDQVLKMVGNTLAKCMRRSDSVGRWGGEEFLIVVAHGEPERLATVADRARGLVAESGLELKGHGRLRVTISLGGAMVREDDTVESLVARADKRMYESKRDGGDTYRLDFAC